MDNKVGNGHLQKHNTGLTGQHCSYIVAAVVVAAKQARNSGSSRVKKTSETAIFRLSFLQWYQALVAESAAGQFG